MAGDYTVYYAGIRDAITLGAAPPVTAESARDAMRIIELGRESAHSGRLMRVTRDA
jgi:scyllo-inositol 2-dehydrogenase (NADP+)